jgi:hypothetical protein
MLGELESAASEGLEPKPGREIQHSKVVGELDELLSLILGRHFVPSIEVVFLLCLNLSYKVIMFSFMDFVTM